jgi:hypothetical protein
MIGPETLRAVGEALFGESWIAPLAADLGVNVRTVERWATGKQETFPGLADELLSLCKGRAESMRKLAVRFEERARAVDRAMLTLARQELPI